MIINAKLSCNKKSILLSHAASTLLVHSGCVNSPYKELQADT